MIDSPITERVWATELDRMICSPAWPLLMDWFTEVMVRLVMTSPDPLQAATEAQASLKGARSLMLAMENERANARGDIDGRRNNGRQPATGNGARAVRATRRTGERPAADAEQAPRQGIG